MTVLVEVTVSLLTEVHTLISVVVTGEGEVGERCSQSGLREKVYQ